MVLEMERLVLMTYCMINVYLFVFIVLMALNYMLVYFLMKKTSEKMEILCSLCYNTCKTYITKGGSYDL